MKPGIDYSSYDPAQFATDHPNDPVLEDARQEAEKLAGRVRAMPLDSERGIDSTREIEQLFDSLHDRIEAKQLETNRAELLKGLNDFTNEKTDGIYKDAFLRLEGKSDPNDSLAAWEGTASEVQRVRETAKEKPEYQAKREQMEQFHAARSEAISHEVHQVQKGVMKERGLELGAPESERKKQARESLEKLGRRESGGKQHSHFRENIPG